MSTPARLVSLLLIPALGVCAGCVKKTLSVRSDPPGALVYLDGLEVGRTPVDNLRFDFYGTREIALHKDGYLSERRTVRVHAPWYAWFPLDIISELIIPWDIRDRRHYHVALRRAEPVPPPVLLRRADEARRLARTRIADARRAADYTPRAYTVQGAGKQFILWAPFTSPPRGKPLYPPKAETGDKREAAP